MYQPMEGDVANARRSNGKGPKRVQGTESSGVFFEGFSGDHLKVDPEEYREFLRQDRAMDEKFRRDAGLPAISPWC